LVTVIGLDIGGANTKAAFLRTKNGYVEELRTAIEYFPIWKNSEKLSSMLSRLKEKVSGNAKVESVGLTMTAELSDAYQTKREGVRYILDCAAQVFADVPVFVLDVEAILVSMDDAQSDTLNVAAANWAATGWLVAQLIKACVIVDVGSTSTSIIPVIDGRVSAVGKTDLEKLMVGELVYTGGLRTNVAAIVKSVPLRNGVAHVSSELFAQSGDVHLVLGNITQAEYTTETADGRGKTNREAMARLARVVCADIKMLTKEEIVQIAKYVYNKQVDQVIEGLSHVYSRVKSLANANIPVVVTGLGKDFLAKTAAKRLRVEKIIDLSKLLPNNAVKASPATGVALMAASKLDRRIVKWTQL
jgi:probable H4MPT-linked C1 transfer pathway protein